MSNLPVDVYGLGQCCLDYIGEIETLPRPDGKEEFSRSVLECGGPVATALVALARWGLSCHFAGIVGDDVFAPMIEASLRDEGIDTSGLLHRRGSSQFACIAVEPAAARRTILWQRPTGEPIRPEEVDTGIVGRAGAVYTDGLFIEAALHACAIAKRSHIPIIVDAGTLREGMLDLARLSDCFIVAEGFARDLTGDGDPAEACRILAAYGPSVVGVTLGSKGYVALAGDRLISKRAYPVEVIDTTGCGDIFHAGVTYGMIRGWSIDRSLDLGAWAAAMVCLEMGGRRGIPSIEALHQRER